MTRGRDNSPWSDTRVRSGKKKLFLSPTYLGQCPIWVVQEQMD